MTDQATRRTDLVKRHWKNECCNCNRCNCGGTVGGHPGKAITKGECGSCGRGSTSENAK